ncbi:MAG: hypothetical protein RIE24_05445 [Silicimonas sp.]|uniref:hypothetical protein n=1 Tax=Alphaproteobacteria TaxID=28211 RepID=UPI0032F04918
MLAIAAARRRVGYVFLDNHTLKDWRISNSAARSSTDAAGAAQEWVNALQPTIVVTEQLEPGSRKGAHTKGVIRAIAKTAERNPVLTVSVARVQLYANKYEEAAALAVRYPELQAWVPQQRRAFDNEPRNTVIFEALALAQRVIDGPPTLLAAAMG